MIREETSITAFPPCFLTSSKNVVITSQELGVPDLETITKVLVSTIRIVGMSFVVDTMMSIPRGKQEAPP